LAAVDGEPAFDEAWQAQVLAIADSLVQNGMFSAGAWSEALGARSQRAGVAGRKQQRNRPPGDGGQAR
jgi:hypothetical protein